MSHIFKSFHSELRFKLAINEINYKSSDDFDPGDWIEIYNPNESSINLSNWVLKDDNDSTHLFFLKALQ